MPTGISSPPHKTFHDYFLEGWTFSQTSQCLLFLFFNFIFRTLPFNKFVMRTSETVHKEYFICPVSTLNT